MGAAVHWKPLKQSRLSEETCTLSTYANEAAFFFLQTNRSIHHGSLESCWLHCPGLAPAGARPAAFCCLGAADGARLCCSCRPYLKKENRKQRRPVSQARFVANTVGLVPHQRCVACISRRVSRHSSFSSGPADSFVPRGPEPTLSPGSGAGVVPNSFTSPFQPRTKQHALAHQLLQRKSWEKREDVYLSTRPPGFSSRFSYRLCGKCVPLPQTTEGPSLWLAGRCVSSADLVSAQKLGAQMAQALASVLKAAKAASASKRWWRVGGVESALTQFVGKKVGNLPEEGTEGYPNLLKKVLCHGLDRGTWSWWMEFKNKQNKTLCKGILFWQQLSNRNWNN